jgi:hypothetical protein
MASSENPKIGPVIQSNGHSDLDPRYLGFFDCFNRQLFFEAHEVLEDLWLGERGKSKGLFYKGLIQLAGAFVHVQKKRWKPAVSLFELARKNLLLYSPVYDGLELAPVVELIGEWLDLSKADGTESDPVTCRGMPNIRLSLPETQERISLITFPVTSVSRKSRP